MGYKNDLRKFKKIKTMWIRKHSILTYPSVLWGLQKVKANHYFLNLYFLITTIKRDLFSYKQMSVKFKPLSNIFTKHRLNLSPPEKLNPYFKVSPSFKIWESLAMFPCWRQIGEHVRSIRSMSALFVTFLSRLIWREKSEMLK